MLKIVTMTLAAAGLLAAGDGEGRRCSLASLKGTYGTILTGTKPSGPPPAPFAFNLRPSPLSTDLGMNAAFASAV